MTRHPGCLPGDVVQQRRFPDAGLAAQDKRPAFTTSNGLNDPVEYGAFAPTPQ